MSYGCKNHISEPIEEEDEDGNPTGEMVDVYCPNCPGLEIWVAPVMVATKLSAIYGGSEAMK